MQQALEYADDARHPVRVLLQRRRLRLPRPHRRQRAASEANLALDAFPSPAELWARYRAWKGLTPEAEQIVLQDYFDDGSGKAPRYYQVNAINAAIEAIAKGQDRILLVMATGTGKTYTAFQIIWRLWKAGRKKRILFLADRNVLVDQTMVNDFRPFGAAMAKLSTNAKTIERDDGTDSRSDHRPRQASAASTPPTKSISASTRPSPARRSGRSCSASSRPASST